MKKTYYEFLLGFKAYNTFLSPVGGSNPHIAIIPMAELCDEKKLKTHRRKPPFSPKEQERPCLPVPERYVTLNEFNEGAGKA